MTPLTSMASGLPKKYVTDKVDHGYLPLYEKFLPHTVEKFMEIGVWKGDSLRLFREYYEGKGEFHAFDIFRPNTGVVDPMQLKQEGFIIHCGSQSDIPFLKTIHDQFDVIIDDGSHHSDEQIISFKHLFVNNIKPGGWYVVEDLVCCREEYWWRSVQGYENTLLAVLERVIQKKRFSGQFFSAADDFQLHALISGIYLAKIHTNPIAFIQKKPC